MEQPTLTCRDERRRKLIRDGRLNGIDYVEVIDCTQVELCVHLFHKVPENLQAANVIIEGGRRIRNIQVKKAWANPGEEGCLRVSVDQAGDFSLYTLRLVQARNGLPTNEPRKDFDPRYAQVQFSFKGCCPSDLDCKSQPVCPPLKHDEPEINYLAKDYSSFRQLILDRLALIMPGWNERHVPDIGIALVEVLAYVGDYLSYFQDAVATEAYLDTARQRISVGRHARLVNYQMHEGCNARTWVTVDTNVDVVNRKVTLRDIYFTTHPQAGEGLVFEPLVEHPEAPLQLYAAHSTIKFYTWSDSECCLPRGATVATLKEDAAGALHLEKGEVLIFEEVTGPKTGNPADADPSRRWAVRLTSVVHSMDPLTQQPVVEIKWNAIDGLPFSFCLSARLPAPDCSVITDVSVARGNVILVDHGKTVYEPLGQVGQKDVNGACDCDGAAIDLAFVPEVFAPVLKQTPITFREHLRSKTPASKSLIQDPRRALPSVTLAGTPGLCPQSGDASKAKPQMGESPGEWMPRLDLLDSHGQEQHFVVEVDNDGQAHLRFGDGDLGHMPEACTIFSAHYRTGNGPVGNVGADTITSFALRTGSLSGAALYPRNPLPAQGGTAQESVEEVKLFAPGAFRKEMLRAVTADDYAQLAEANTSLQRAGANLRWTGSWYEARVAVDPLGSEQPNKELLRKITSALYRSRRMGHDLEVVKAQYVSLDIELTVGVLPHYLRGHVEAALLDVFSARVLPDGTLGFFHPDKLTFGEGVYLSQLVAAAQALAGVESVRVTRLQRYGEGPNGEKESGVLPLGPLEVAQLDNDPNFPEHGRLSLVMRGGR